MTTINAKPIESVWSHKETSQLATALAEWLVPMWYYTELRSKLCDVNFLIRKTLYCNFVSLKTSFERVDEIYQERQIQYETHRYVLLVHYQRLLTIKEFIIERIETEKKLKELEIKKKDELEKLA